MVTNTCTRQCRLLIVVQPVRICGCQQLQEWTMGTYNVHELFWMLQCVTVPRNYSFHPKFRPLVYWVLLYTNENAKHWTQLSRSLYYSVCIYSLFFVFPSDIWSKLKFFNPFTPRSASTGSYIANHITGTTHNKLQSQPEGAREWQTHNIHKIQGFKWSQAKI